MNKPMSVKAMDIKGFLIEKIEKPLTGIKKDDEEVMKLSYYNQAIDAQGEQRLALNRVKGIKVILKLWTKYDRLNVQKDSEEEASDIIDEIRKFLPQLLEVSNEQ